MKNILLSTFESVYSLESFLIEVNLKLTDQNEKDKLKTLLQHLSTIVIAFDFKLNGPFKSCIDKRFTYEQLLYLCYVKINDSKLHIHENHMLKTANKFAASNFNANLDLNFLKLPKSALEKKLFAIENISLSYFLAKDESSDGKYWRELYDLVGGSIMKFILQYSFVFRRLKSKAPGGIYVQVCGCKLNAVHKSLLAKKMEIEDKCIVEKSLNKKKARKAPLASTQINAEIKEKNVEMRSIEVSKENKENVKPETGSKNKKSLLHSVFETREKELIAESNNQKSSINQLKSFGHKPLDKTSFLYDRNLSSKIKTKYVYSNKTIEFNINTASRIVNEFILKGIDFGFYLKEDSSSKRLESDIVDMKSQLSSIMLDCINKYRTCPFNIFLSCFCHNKFNKDTGSVEIAKSKPVKRKRSHEDDEDKPRSENSVKDSESTSLKHHVEKKKVYAFLRRSLMHTLDYKDKVEKIDLSCALIGGKANFKCLIKKLRLVINSLKYDTFILNNLLHDIKFARISYLKPIKCDRYKRLILMGVIRWLFEDYAFQIIKSRFYVTDTSKTNSELFYYLKSDWRCIFKSQLSDKNYREKYNLEKIKEADAKAYCSKFESNGIHLGRLLPKNVDNECRIISGCNILNPCNKKVFNINFRFITLNNCLNWLIRTDPSLTGFACVGHKQMHKKYAKFLSLNYLNRSNLGCSDPLKKWNFMKFDVLKCFDSINIKQLVEYIDDLFNKYLGNEHVMTLMRFSKVQFDTDNKNLKTKYDYLTVKHHFHEKGFLNGISDFIRIMELNQTNDTNKNSNKAFDTIFVPLGIHERNVNCKKLRDSARKCVEHVIIKIHDEIYERMNGILQGSICSRNLCDLFLGRIERKLFFYDDAGFAKTSSNSSLPFKLNRSNDLILRVVDDYLVISSDYDRLEVIKTLISSELKLNEKKTVVHKWTRAETGKYLNPNLNNYLDKVNSEFDVLQPVAKASFIDNYTKTYFSWYGLDIDVHTFDVYYNYDKYFDTTNLKNRINTTNHFRYPFIQFNLKFLRLFTVNISNLIIDHRTNSVQAILRNFVDLFSLSAIRFFILYKTMPQQLVNNAKLQVKLILNLCYWVNNRIGFGLGRQLLQYFYSTFSLLKFLCFTTYLNLIERVELNGVKKHSGLFNLIKINLKKLNFSRCIKADAEFIYIQLTELIEQQSDKFKQCQV